MKSVWVIMETVEMYGRPLERLCKEQGFFTDEEAASLQCDNLSGSRIEKLDKEYRDQREFAEDWDSEEKYEPTQDDFQHYYPVELNLSPDND